MRRLRQAAPQPHGHLLLGLPDGGAVTRRHGRIVADLHRLLQAVEAIDLDNPPTGRAAVRALNQLEVARSDVTHDLAFLVDWLTSKGGGAAVTSLPGAPAGVGPPSRASG